MVSSATSHHALRVLLLIFAVIQLIAGLGLLFASGWFLSVMPGTLHLFASEYADLMLKVFAMLALFAAYLSYAASRDPVRYLAIIDAYIFLLLAAAAIDVYAAFILHLSLFLAAPLVAGRIIIRVALALVLMALRPRGVKAAF